MSFNPISLRGDSEQLVAKKKTGRRRSDVLTEKQMLQVLLQTMRLIPAPDSDSGCGL